MDELVMGDSNTGNDVFDSVGFRGARLYSSDSMYPIIWRNRAGRLLHPHAAPDGPQKTGRRRSGRSR